MTNWVTILHLLKKHGANIDVQNRKGLTPLMIASGRGKVEFVAQLLTWGASANKKSYDHNTALHFVCGAGDLDVEDGGLERNIIDIAHFLLEAKADVKQKNKIGQSPIGIAKRRHRLALVTLLLERTETEVK